ncbi:MAG: hypothetical protein EXS09_18740 [Gemmataceae bacterium]|nr:hypothetical protein [Gemmataceae bacterium]
MSHLDGSRQTNNSATFGDFHGGAGDDTIIDATNNNGGTPKSGPAGGILLEGEAGSHTLTNGNWPITFGSTFETAN